MKATFKDIVPGKILYYVFCVKAQSAQEAEICKKVIVTSFPYIDSTIGLWRFDCIDIWNPNSNDSWEHKDAHHFLHDCGIDKHGEYSHNLHRLFTNEKSALAYVDECKTGKFSSPVDQSQYDNDLKYKDFDDSLKFCDYPLYLYEY